MNNRLKFTNKSIYDLENKIVKQVSRNCRPMSIGSHEIEIETNDGDVYNIFQEPTCCERIQAKLPENIQNLYNRKISVINMNAAEGEKMSEDYEFLANIKITDSLGEEYNIEFTGKSTGCSYYPDIGVTKEWVACVFD